MGHDRDGLYRRTGSPYWYYSWTDATGQRQQRSTRCKLKGDAQAVLDRARVDARSGTCATPAKPIGFEALARRYSEVACTRPSWMPVGRWLVAQLIARFGDTPITHLGTQALQSYQAELAQRARPLQPASINRLVGQLKAILTAAVDWRLLPDGHLAQLRRVKPVKGATRRERYLTDREIARLIIACEPPPKVSPPLPHNPCLKAIVTTALATGMRKGELFALTWADIDQARGLVHVRRSKNGEPRTLWVGRELLDELRAMRVPRPIDGAGLVFPSPKGGAGLTSLQSSWERARAKAGLVDVHFHDLRHTAASAWAMAGLSLLQIAQLLGHRTMAMVKRYAHLAPGQGPDALSRLGWRLPDEQPGDRDKIVTLPRGWGRAKAKKKATGSAPVAN